MIRTTTIDVDAQRTPLIRWGAVVAGAVWGLAVMAVLASLWLALAFPSGVDVIRDNLEWFMAASGAFSLFVAGVVAGALTDNRGPGSGWLHGMTAWGLLLIAALVFGVPSAFGLFSAGELRTIQGGDLVGQGASDAMWATFLTLVVGAVLGGLGGTIGGTPRRSVGTAGSMVPGSEDDRFDTSRARTDEQAFDRDRRLTQRSDDDRLRADVDDRAETSVDERAETSVDDRVMVRRSADGSYVDQEGRRYVPEGTSTNL